MADEKPDDKADEIAERSSPSGKVVYHAIMKEADEELERPSNALFWSGLAAGLSMGFSFIGEALLQSHLPDTKWRPLVSKFGYCFGFIIVILGRQQLFTENTLTPVLPLLLRKDAHTLSNMLRLWGVVLIANLLGALAIGLVLGKGHIFDANVQATFWEMGHHSMQHGFWMILVRGIFAGWLIAMIVWLLPFAESAHIWVIIALTYLVGIAEFSHIVAGSIKVFTLAWAGEKPWLKVLLGFGVPALIGNTIGGVALVAALNHAQVIGGGEGTDV